MSGIQKRMDSKDAI